MKILFFWLPHNHQRININVCSGKRDSSVTSPVCAFHYTPSRVELAVQGNCKWRMQKERNRKVKGPNIVVVFLRKFRRVPGYNLVAGCDIFYNLLFAISEMTEWTWRTPSSSRIKLSHCVTFEQRIWLCDSQCISSFVSIDRKSFSAAGDNIRKCKSKISLSEFPCDKTSAISEVRLIMSSWV